MRAEIRPVRLLELQNLSEALFIRRPNRFVGLVQLDGQEVRIHIPDPGRLTELLYPGNVVLVQEAPDDPSRKTAWSLVAARGTSGWVLVNTFLHRRISEAILSHPGISPFGKLSSIRAEVTPEGRESRFDFLLELTGGDEAWLEVKGCTLREGSFALFPDAPTVRGARHLRELTAMASAGENCALMVLVFPPDVTGFSPNRMTDPTFADAFDEAISAGVRIYPVCLNFDGVAVRYCGTIPVVSLRSPPKCSSSRSCCPD